MEKGLIFDIQGYSVHDGPGCRTLVFLSGCPLGCSWCSNPEGRYPKKRMMFRRSKCVPKNYHCMKACPYDAVAIGEDGFPVFDRKLCDRCETFECSDSCMKEAVRVAGREITVDELIRLLKRDQGYWGEDGGVTFTGGEPLAQKDFLKAALKKCRENYMHTAIETCACAPTDTLLEVQKLVDFIFVDIKQMDPKKHEEGTGQGNELILKNIKAAAKAKWDGRLVIRLPLVPGFNDSEENLKTTADFMKSNGLGEINILSFHRLGTSKYEQLGLDYGHKNTEPPTAEMMAKAARIFEDHGIRCHVDEGTPF